MAWEAFGKRGTLRATGERVIVWYRDAEQGKVRFRREERTLHTGTKPLPRVRLEEANADEIELDEQ